MTAQKDSTKERSERDAEAIARVGTFYYSTEDGAYRQPIRLPNGGTVYIRVTEAQTTMLDALDNAEPQPGESVMNTHELPEGSR